MSIGLHFSGVACLKEKVAPYLILSPHCLALVNTQHVCGMGGWTVGRTNRSGKGLRAEPRQEEGPAGTKESGVSTRSWGAAEQHPTWLVILISSCPDGINQGQSAQKYQSTVFYSSSLELNYVVRIGQSRNGKDQAGWHGAVKRRWMSPVVSIQFFKVSQGKSDKYHLIILRHPAQSLPHSHSFHFCPSD